MDEGQAFLEANKEKDGVVTLPSGLQYRVLEEGGGLQHPTLDSPCECHYAGRLLDGSEFDSSYKRGAPTTFAPNQVIKGWTEAMQLMVVGDKWEMYIPMELAYGPNGKPPKIPPAATLIFQVMHTPLALGCWCLIRACADADGDSKDQGRQGCEGDGVPNVDSRGARAVGREGRGRVSEMEGGKEQEVGGRQRDASRQVPHSGGSGRLAG